MRLTFASLALLPLLSLPLAAHADTAYDVSITNTAVGFDAEFALPASFTTDPDTFGVYHFYYGSVPGTLNGLPTIFTPNYYPYTSLLGEVLFGIDGAVIQGFPMHTITTEPYPSTDATLTILPGSFVSRGYFDTNSAQPYFFNVNVTPETATVTPEPSSLLLVGTALVTSAMLLAGKRRPGLHRRS